MMACKICNPPAAGMCRRCEVEVKTQVLEAADRIRARLSGMSRQLAGAEVLKEERRLVNCSNGLNTGYGNATGGGRKSCIIAGGRSF